MVQVLKTLPTHFPFPIPHPIPTLVVDQNTSLKIHYAMILMTIKKIYKIYFNVDTNYMIFSFNDKLIEANKITIMCVRY
jgi:hypothetical protein